MTANEIRQEFLDFFKSKSHQIVSSAPIVLKDDPTLMFTNSGMNQFKDIFLGYSKAKYKTAANSQKCLRVSGKHNDLDDVGKDTYHHTMFEMLGNWSFGDYFKKEAIGFAWELLVDIYKLDKESLYVSVFEGDEKEGLKKDTEALDLWKKHVPEARIINGNKKDNFWEMGDSGPCGPCSEIHIDLRSEEEKKKVPGKDLVNNDHPEVIEIWNLVFMQYLRKADGTLEDLPSKHIDTGMGLERICMAIQNKKSNYDTDVFSGLIKRVEAESGIKYGEKKETDIAIRVIVDHLRAVVFSIADGQMPSNNGSGYVIRRILRRAVSYYYRFLKIETAFIFKLADVLSDEMGVFYSEIEKQKDFIKNVIKEEEQSFISTISGGLLRINQLIKSHTDKEKMLAGDKIFELYDTFGFPSDLSEIIALEKGYAIDLDGFEEEMQKQKQRSKSASEFSVEDWIILDDNKKPEFLGYDTLETETSILQYRKVNKKDKVLYQLVLEKTPFYAEGGGQVGDIGYLAFKDEKINVIDTKKENNLWIHFTDKLPTKVDAIFKAVVNYEKRNSTTKNHTATHLLHLALNKILGKHVDQKGSFVGPDYMRFDFSHFSKISAEELTAIEKSVNDYIFKSTPLKEKREVPFEEAVKEGANALFGEKYGETVRVIQFENSKELCGGTHVRNTSEIGLFIIISESSVAAGIRRIEAITGLKALNYLKKQEEELLAIKKLLKITEKTFSTVEKVLSEKAFLEKELEAYIKKESAIIQENLLGQIKQLKDCKYLVENVMMSSNEIKSFVHRIRKEHNKIIAIIGSKENGKAIITVAISDELANDKVFDAKGIIKELSPKIQGGGGGQSFFATAGGKNPDGIREALDLGEKIIKETLCS